MMAIDSTFDSQIMAIIEILKVQPTKHLTIITNGHYQMQPNAT